MPDCLRPVIDRATARRPALRFQTVRDFAVELIFAAVRGGLGVAAARPMSPGDRAPKPTPRWLDPIRRVGLAAIGAAAGFAAAAPLRSSSPIIAAAERRVVVAERPGAAIEPAVGAEATPEAAAPAPSAPPRQAQGARDAKGGQRARLEARLRTGEGDLTEAFQFRRMCWDAADDACAARANRFIEALERSGR